MSNSTRLVQINIDNLRDAGTAFSRTHGNIMPLVLVPSRRACCNIFMRVPSDSYVMMQKWGRHVPEDGTHYTEAGFKVLGPQYRVAFLVSRQAATYSAALEGVPTKDNINVDIDITIVFKISNPRAFVYSLGCLRFDEYLQAATQEAIRSLVRENHHSRILSLKGQFGQTLLNSLNRKFMALGVKFDNVNITNVKLPTELMELLKTIQTFESKTTLQLETHRFEMTRLKDNNKQTVTKIEHKLALRLARLANDKAHVTQEMSKTKTQAKTDYTVAISKAKRQAQILTQQAKNKLETAKVKMEQKQTSRVAKARAECEASKRKADAALKNNVRSAQAKFVEASRKIEGRILEAKAEGEAVQTFARRRAYELSLRRINIITKLASGSKIVITGDAGNKLVAAVAAADLL